MPVNTTRWVLWLSLLILLPLPFHIFQWGLLPLGVVLKSLLFGDLQRLHNLSLRQEAFIFTQCLLAMLINALISWGYGHYTLNWQERIRGSVMGITVLSMLMIFSSIAIYSNPVPARVADNKPIRMTFLQVYP